MGIFRTAGLILCGLLLSAAALGQGAPAFSAAEYELVETAIRPDASSVAWVLQGQGHQVLFVDGEEVARADALAQVHLAPDGQVVYWRTVGDQEVVVYRGEAGPRFDQIVLPDLDQLAQLGTPRPSEWSYLGGARVAFGARERNGDWTALLRFPAAPQNQEKRPLPVTFKVYESPDPSSRTHRPLHYRLLKAKIPVYIGIRGDEECIVIGREEAACGQEVALLAVPRDQSRVAFAIRTPAGLELHTEFGVTQPTTNIDWISYSPDGRHLAWSERRNQQYVIVVDGQPQGSYELVSALTWLPDQRTIALVHNPGGSQILVDGQPTLEKHFIERLLVAPDGRMVVVGKEQGRPFVDPFGRPGNLTSIWGEGFLPNGSFFGLLRRSDSTISILLDDQLSDGFAGVNRVAASPDGNHLVGVGAAIDSDTVLLDTKPWQSIVGRVERFTWCGGSRLMVLDRQAEQECLVTPDREPVCCPRFVAFGCDEDGYPYYACLKEGKYHVTWSGPRGTTQGPFDDVPLHLVYQDAASGELHLAARAEQEWSLVVRGQYTPISGKVLQVLPMSNGPWYLEQVQGRVRWHTRISASDWYDSASAPIDYGSMTIYRGRLNGKECLAQDVRKIAWHDAIVSPVYPVEGGGFYWARDGETVSLRAFEEF